MECPKTRDTKEILNEQIDKVNIAMFRVFTIGKIFAIEKHDNYKVKHIIIRPMPKD